MSVGDRETFLPHYKFSSYHHGKMKRCDRRMLFLLLIFVSFLVYIGYLILKFFGAGARDVDQQIQSLEFPPPQHSVTVAKKDYRLKLDIYMESLCPDTTDFVQQQLWPNWARVKDLAHTSVKLLFTLLQQQGEKTWNLKRLDLSLRQSQRKHGKRCTGWSDRGLWIPVPARTTRVPFEPNDGVCHEAVGFSGRTLPTVYCLSSTGE